MVRKYNRRRYKKKRKTNVRTIVKREIDKNLERYTLLSTCSGLQISSNDYNARMWVYSLTGGYHVGLVGNLGQTVTEDANMASLFTLQPLGGATSGGNSATEGAFGGGTAEDSTSSGFRPGYQSLRGLECKLKRFRANYQIAGAPANDSPYAVHMMCVETRRPLGASIPANGGLQNQIFLRSHLQTGTGIGPQPSTHLAMIDYSTVKRVLWKRDYIIQGSANAGNLKIGKMSINLERKCYWKYCANPAAGSNALTYCGPFIYLVFWRDGTYAETDPPVISMSSMLTLQDA